MGNQTNYLILVNEENKLPDGFEETVGRITVENSFGRKFEIEKKTYDAFMRLREDVLKEDSLQIELISVFRNREQQQKIFDSNLEKFGLEYARKYSALPGYSEHHTGLAVDVGVFHEGKLYWYAPEILTVEYLYKPIHKKAPEYGFILRYPDHKKSVTKVAYEPWHLRYLDSPKIAKEITDNGLCFEEYCESLKENEK